ncbi:hypothetical protein [Salibacterium aidingense]|uniref:hypothetical protein n=1 Tax=Salibacterium aidingense TaxID=384933 RepID=UPI000408E026|nr:hypothetical protein [Salibacterium aidingense]
MKSLFLIMTGIAICVTSACKQDYSPEAGGTAAEQLRGPGPAQIQSEEKGVTPSDYNQGPGDVSMTTKKQNQGNDKARVRAIAENLGFSPMYVTFGGRHAYVYTNSDQSWSKQEKKEKQQELKQKYKQELPRYQVHVNVLNG